MLLQRTRAGASAGGPLVCLRCYLKIASSGGGARRTISTAAALTVGNRLQPFFDRSGPANGPGAAVKTARIGGGYFFGNERLFVGSRRMIIGTAGQAPAESASTTETVKLAAAETVANATAAAAAAVETSGIKTSSSATPADTRTQAEILQALPAHRRRKYLKDQAAAAAVATSLPLTNPDASDLLTTAASDTKPNLKRLFFTYLSLAKPRLTALIVLSAACSYALFPLPPLLASPDTPSLSTLTLLYLTIGTTLASASANTFNMYLEPKYDAQMSRTRNRPLARGLLTKRQALIFAILTGGAGTLALWYGVNPTVSGLGALNIFLYAGVYTPLKRISIANTWVGAVVGGIPPLMGWAAAAGGTSTITPLAADATTIASWMDEPTALLSHPGSWILATILFAWQFPHFCALSTPIATEYRNAGYQMMSWKNPALNTRVALRYSLLTFPLCFGLTYVGVTDYGFVFTSSVVNAWLVKEAWKFWKSGGAGGSARGLFWASVWHLPVVMVLAMVHKEGLWRRVWTGVRGLYYGNEEEEEDWLVEA